MTGNKSARLANVRVEPERLRRYESEATRRGLSWADFVRAALDRAAGIPTEVRRESQREA